MPDPLNTEVSEFFPQIINSITDPIFIKDREHRWILVNDAYCELMGHPREELIGKLDSDYFPREKAMVCWGRDERAFKEGGSNINEDKFSAITGETKIILTRKTIFTAPGGRKILVGILRDITERKRTEEARREMEDRLSLALGVSKAATYEHMVPVEKGVYLSERWAAILGYKTDELPPMEKLFTWWAERLHPDDRPRVLQAYQDFIAGRDLDYNIEFRQKHRSGRWVYLHALAKAVERDDDNRAIRIVGVEKDITKHKRHEESLKKYQKNLEKQVEERTRELHEKITELERLHNAMVDREFRIKELRDEVEKLKFRFTQTETDKSSKTGRYFERKQ